MSESAAVATEELDDQIIGNYRVRDANGRFISSKKNTGGPGKTTENSRSRQRAAKSKAGSKARAKSQKSSAKKQTITKEKVANPESSVAQISTGRTKKTRAERRRESQTYIRTPYSRKREIRSFHVQASKGFDAIKDVIKDLAISANIAMGIEDRIQIVDYSSWKPLSYRQNRDFSFTIDFHGDQEALHEFILLLCEAAVCDALKSSYVCMYLPLEVYNEQAGGVAGMRLMDLPKEIILVDNGKVISKEYIRHEDIQLSA